jgi:hypothetical protein
VSAAARRSGWLSVDIDGMSQVLARRGGFAWLLYELLQNCYDTKATAVHVVTERVGRQWELSVVDDDPDGFKNLTHAYTLFAPSEKKAHSNKRGRYNVGEKLVLGFCDEAEVISTTGHVRFQDNGLRSMGRGRRERGTEFRALLRLKNAEVQEMLSGADLLLPPIPTYVNGRPLPTRTPSTTFETTLPTELADAEGSLRRTARKTTVRVYDLQPGETGRIYEMGIPVVETGDPWTVEVMQKVPLNIDRDNVTPAYLRELRVAVVNATFGTLTPDHAASTAVRDALHDARIEADAVKTIVIKSFGDKCAIFDPHDREANHTAVAHGHTVIAPNALRAEQWAQVRRAKAALPSGHLFPSPKPYSTDPNAPVAEVVPESEWTDGMRNVADYCVDVARHLLRKTIHVRFERAFNGVANYGDHRLCFNLGQMGKAFFDHGPSQSVDELLLHELAHEYEANHLSAEFHDAICRLGAKLKILALTEPELFVRYGWK